MLFLTQVEVVVEVVVEGSWLAASYYNSVEVKLYFSGRTADGGRTGRSDNSAISAPRCSCS